MGCLGYKNKSNERMIMIIGGSMLFNQDHNIIDLYNIDQGKWSSMTPHPRQIELTTILLHLGCFYTFSDAEESIYRKCQEKDWEKFGFFTTLSQGRFGRPVVIPFNFGDLYKNG